MPVSSLTPGVPAYDILAPKTGASPTVFASPHSGDHYPEAFLAASSLKPLMLRRSEDAFVDRLFADAPVFGAALVRARYARVYLDMNREAYELDPAMFKDALPSHANTTSLRVAGGLGTIARMVAEGAEVYRNKLEFAEAEARVRDLYLPYHAALAARLAAAHAEFGFAVLIDCHSMPSQTANLEPGHGKRRPDFVLGDRFGSTCSRALTDMVHDLLSHMGYYVVRNNPYAGGYTTSHYGRPHDRIHALQIEINRSLYMDEQRIEPLDTIETVRSHLRQLTAILSSVTAKMIN